MIPSTRDRVPIHSSAELNKKISLETQARVERFRNASSVEIEMRLQELDREWDIERAIEANASSIVVLGIALGTFVNRRFYLLPLLVGGFLFQHAVQGWCPPVPVLRRLGFRTSYEIEEERYALKALRGDFWGLDNLGQSGPESRPSADEVLAAVRG